MAAGRLCCSLLLLPLVAQGPGNLLCLVRTSSLPPPISSHPFSLSHPAKAKPVQPAVRDSAEGGSESNGCPLSATILPAAATASRVGDSLTRRQMCSLPHSLTPFLSPFPTFRLACKYLQHFSEFLPSLACAHWLAKLLVAICKTCRADSLRPSTGQCQSCGGHVTVM